MKHIVKLAIAVMLVAALAACGSNSSSAPVSSSSEVASSIAAEVTPMVETMTVAGTVTAVAADSISIETEDKKVLTFALTETVDLTMAADLKAADMVTVCYTGEIAEDGKTEGATVVALMLTGTETVPAVELQPAAATSEVALVEEPATEPVPAGSGAPAAPAVG